MLLNFGILPFHDTQTSMSEAEHVIDWAWLHMHVINNTVLVTSEGNQSLSGSA